MTPEHIKSLSLNLQQAGQMPRSPLVTADPQKDWAALQFDYADMVVDFDHVLDMATKLKASGFTITADTIVLKQGTDLSITGDLQIVTLIARRIIVENGGKARIRLDHSESSSVRTFNIIASEIADKLSLASAGANVHEYELNKAKRSGGAKPKLYSYSFRSGKVREGAKPVPVGYLTWDQPLYKTLTASYALAAGLLGENDSDEDYLALSEQLLLWILSWAGLESDTAQISRNASNLLGLMPSIDTQTEKLNITMPPIPAEKYLLLASTRLSFAQQVEMDGKLANMSSNAQEVARDFGAAMSRRDRIASTALSDEMESVKFQVKKTQQLIKRTSEMLEREQLKEGIEKIHLDLAVELDRIDKIAKGAIEIAIGLISLVGSIASIAGGVPADPGAGTKKGRDGVQGLFDALKAAKVDGSFGKTLLNLYKMPITFLWKNKDDLSESVKELAAASVSIMSAVNAINSLAGAHGDTDRIAEQVGEAVRSLADKPTAAEAISAWDIMEMEANNALDTAINSADAGSVKDALTNYKSAVQRIAIYGRLLVDQQVRKDEQERHLGSLVLQKIAALEKADSFAAIINGNLSEAEIIEKIKAESEHSMDVARQSFYEASYGFRRAQFYETYSFPRMVPSYCENAAAMGAVYNDMETDNSVAPSGFAEFNRKFVVSDREVLEKVRTNQAVPIKLPLDMANFETASHVRLKTIEVKLNSTTPISELISVTMESESFFEDRRAGQEVKIDGHGFSVTFEYDEDGVQLKNDFAPVMPTPFSAWILKANQPLNLPELTSIDITLIGRSAL